MVKVTVGDSRLWVARAVLPGVVARLVVAASMTSVNQVSFAIEVPINFRPIGNVMIMSMAGESWCRQARKRTSCKYPQCTILYGCDDSLFVCSDGKTQERFTVGRSSLGVHVVTRIGVC